MIERSRCQLYLRYRDFVTYTWWFIGKRVDEHFEIIDRGRKEVIYSYRYDPFRIIYVFRVVDHVAFSLCKLCLRAWSIVRAFVALHKLLSSNLRLHLQCYLNVISIKIWTIVVVKKYKSSTILQAFKLIHLCWFHVCIW